MPGWDFLKMFPATDQNYLTAGKCHSRRGKITQTVSIWYPGHPIAPSVIQCWLSKFILINSMLK